MSFAISTFVFAFGVSKTKAQITEAFNTVPVPGWFTQNNSVPVGSTGWFRGTKGDFPARGDCDGDGKANFVIQRGPGNPATFWTRLATGTISTTVFGNASDLIVPGDYDGDGKTDIATTRFVSGSLQWQYLASSNNTINYIIFGASNTERRVPGDYDGDGRTYVAVWRNGAF